MKTRVAACALIFAVVAFAVPAIALADGAQSPTKGKRAGVAGIRAGVTIPATTPSSSRLG
jgi:hypothetical protein